MEDVCSDSQWLIRMVENLLTVTRIDGQRVQVTKTPTVLEELVGAVLVKFRKHYPQQEIRVQIPEEFISIPMDAMLIQQVLMNLLENAVVHAKGMTELVLRVKRMGAIGVSGPDGVFHLRDLEIDYDRRQVSIAGGEIKLTQTEYNILAFLSQHTGKVLTYTAIISSIWGRIDEGSTKKLQVNMANIRKKLGTVPGDDRNIINELGVGYRMQDPPLSDDES